ncbi:hypothetical protein SAMN05443428_11044 [Caloramator quimbayensis]|uniref:Uncharacterized protein n=1 Tax=Caloramator quimbayensis TaxID=1147123 RepID=A0A1T4XL88_9CLOT|nr:hypothetical protein [Caloramator quimbayensis]SKA90153.1 hypothetical protein SAMN05443428_11044 [Caloramator quimbayensis]
MNYSDLLSNFNIDENYIDIILLILIISSLYSFNNNTYSTCPYYSPCCEWDKNRKKHKKHSKNIKAESLNKDCCQNNNCAENTFGFFNSYSSNSQDNILFTVLIIALLFLIQKLNKNEDLETENKEE